MIHRASIAKSTRSSPELHVTRRDVCDENSLPSFVEMTGAFGSYSLPTGSPTMSPEATFNDGLILVRGNDDVWSNGRTTVHLVLVSSSRLRLLLLWHLWSTEQRSCSRLFVYFSAIVNRVYVFDYLFYWSRDQQIWVAQRWSMMTDSLSLHPLMCFSINVDLNYHRVTERY